VGYQIIPEQTLMTEHGSPLTIGYSSKRGMSPPRLSLDLNAVSLIFDLLLAPASYPPRRRTTLPRAFPRLGKYAHGG
jgi:hypothetical protein